MPAAMKYTDPAISCFKSTTDRWWSEFKIADDKRYEGGFVNVSLRALPGGIFRCCVWGNDNFGLDFDTLSYGPAERMYVTICKMTDVRVDDLLVLGFVRS